MKRLSHPGFLQLSFLTTVQLELVADRENETLCVLANHKPLLNITQQGEIFVLRPATISTNAVSGIPVDNLTMGFTLNPSHSVTFNFDTLDEIEVNRVNIKV